MSSNPLKKVDSFDSWNDNVEGHDSPSGAGVIQGTLLRFTNTAQWLTRDDVELPADLPLIAVEITRVVQMWKNGKPEKTTIVEPGQPIPDVDAMNAEIPESEWEQGPDGKPRGPWQVQRIVYLLDPTTMEKYTFPTGTTGGRIAIGDLRDKIVWMRKTRGPNIYAVVTLGDTFMKTKFGGRQRPHFNIVQWTRLGGNDLDLQALPAPAAPPAPAATLVPVAEPTAEEDFNDELPGDLGPPKPATKGKAVTNRKRSSEAA